MAESFLRSAHFGKKRLVVNTHVPEALVWKATRGALGRVEAARLVRDELRVARAADAVATFDADEAEAYRAKGIAGTTWLDLRLPPVAQVDVAATPRRLVLMGTRDWAPNQEAFLDALRLWPKIADGIEDAELCVIGAKKTGTPDATYPAGVRDLGFVDDLHGFLATCRAMIAPVRTGGGVRVKLLDAIRMGLPIVGTTAAVGSLNRVFELRRVRRRRRVRRANADACCSTVMPRSLRGNRSSRQIENSGLKVEDGEQWPTLILGRDPDIHRAESQARRSDDWPGSDSGRA